MNAQPHIRYWRAHSRRVPRGLWVTGWRQRILKLARQGR